VPVTRPSHFEDLYAADAEARERADDLANTVGAAR